MFRSSVLALVVCLGAGVLAAATPDVGIHISPTTVTIPHGEQSSSFIVRNESANAVTFDVLAFAWSNRDGVMDLETTDDVIVFPGRFVIGGGETRRVRVGTRVAATGQERAYRIILQQPSTDAAAGPGVAIRLKFNMPLFIRPESAVARVELGAPRVAAGELRVPLRNLSGLHVTPRQVRLVGTTSDGVVTWSRDLELWYLLAGERREYVVQLTPEECRQAARIEAKVAFLEGSALTLSETAVVSPGACAVR